MELGTYVGWMGEMSVPMTSASGNSSPKSMAQMPVPVPMSRTLLGSLTGARKSLPSMINVEVWWMMSKASEAWLSFDAQY